MGRHLDQDEVLLAAARTMMALSVRATAEVEGQVSAVQLRALTVLEQLGEVNLVMLSDTLGIGRPATSRLCDRLVIAGLVDRAQSRTTRREIVLNISRAGERLLAELDSHRLRHLRAALNRLPASRRSAVLTALDEFARAAGRQMISGTV